MKTTCRRCGEEKPRTAEFWEPCGSCSDGFRMTCRECRRPVRKASERKYRETKPHLVKAKYDRWAKRPENKGRVAEIKKLYRQNNREKEAERNRKYKVLNRERLNAYQQARRYGMTVAQYAGMVKEQDGKCAICGATGRALNVDHDHQTGAVRGLLCSPCNVGLGRFNDRQDILKSAITYLRRYYDAV